MKERIFLLRRLDLDRVSAQAALLESRNEFFSNGPNNNPDGIIEAALVKKFDKNIYAAGVKSNIREFVELNANMLLGVDFFKYFNAPIYLKKIIRDTLIEIAEATKAEKEKKEKEDKKKNRYNKNNRQH